MFGSRLKKFQEMWTSTKPAAVPKWEAAPEGMIVPAIDQDWGSRLHPLDRLRNSCNRQRRGYLEPISRTAGLILAEKDLPREYRKYR